MAVADDDLVAGRVYKPVGFAKRTLVASRNLDEATELTAGKRLSECKGKPIRAMIQAEVQAIRWTDDPDVDPTTAIGMVIAAGSTLEYDGDLSKIRIFPAVAGAIANISFYGV